MICLILCFQQTSEIDNLIASWGKVFWLCCMQVPRCCWHQSYALDKASSISSLVPLPKLASNNLQKWFLSPTGQLNFGFITEGKLTIVLLTPYSWGSQLVHAPGNHEQGCGEQSEAKMKSPCSVDEFPNPNQNLMSVW
jgi:hypothetical protein